MFIRPTICFCCCILITASANGITTSVDKVAEAIAAIQKVGPNGAGHDAAVQAMTILNAAAPDQIPIILEGMNDKNRLAVNWLRSAVIKIAEASDRVPQKRIREYFDDRQRSHLGRLLAFDLLTEENEELRNQLIPTLVDDPSLPLRYKAIANLIEQAKGAEEIQSYGLLGIALDKARDVDQVIRIAKSLDEKGISVDIQKQLGFINSWQLVGNFDNSDENGFDVVYGPELNLQEVDLTASYDDVKEDSINGSWVSHNTTDEQGIVDLNSVVGKIKDVIVYAHATFDSDSERQADIRIGCINAHKVWVNGKLVMANEIYHNGISPDKFIGQTTLKKGSNDILVKVCQNNQTQQWAQRWQFQLRICDESGKAFSSQDDETSE